MKSDKILLLDAGGILFNRVTEDTAFFALSAEILGADAMVLAHDYHCRDQEFECDDIDVMDIFMSHLNRPTNPEVVAAEIDACYMHCVQAQQWAFELVRHHKVNLGCKILLANNEARRWDCLKNRKWAHFDVCDGLVSSWVVRYCKPTPEYFHKICQLNWARIEDLWLVDDNPEVIEAAEKLGIKTFTCLNSRDLDAAFHTILAELG